MPKLSDTSGRGFVKLLLSELEGALDRAAGQVGDQAAGRADQAVGQAAEDAGQPGAALPPPATVSSDGQLSHNE